MNTITEQFNTFTTYYKDQIDNPINTQMGGQTTTQSQPTQSEPTQSQQNLQTRISDMQDTNTYTGASTNLFLNIAKLVYEYVILYSLKIINFFYQRLETELKSLAGDSQSASDEIDENRRLLKAISIVIESPAFQKKWNEFTTIITELVGSLATKIREEIDGELGAIANDVTELVYTNTKTAVYGAGLGVLDGICALPPMMPICELMIVVGTGSKLSSESFLTFMRSVSRMANAFSNVFGDTSETFANTIKESLELYSTITDVLSNTSNIGVNVLNRASETVSSLTPSVREPMARPSILPPTQPQPTQQPTQPPILPQPTQPTLPQQGGKRTQSKRKSKRVKKTTRKQTTRKHRNINGKTSV